MNRTKNYFFNLGEISKYLGKIERIPHPSGSGRANNRPYLRLMMTGFLILCEKQKWEGLYGQRWALFNRNDLEDSLGYKRGGGGGTMLDVFFELEKLGLVEILYRKASKRKVGNRYEYPIDLGVMRKVFRESMNGSILVRLCWSFSGEEGTKLMMEECGLPSEIVCSYNSFRDEEISKNEKKSASEINSYLEVEVKKLVGEAMRKFRIGDGNAR